MDKIFAIALVSYLHVFSVCPHDLMTGNFSSSFTLPTTDL